MDIINVTTTKTAEKRTESGVYTVEYTIANNELIRVQFNISDVSSENIEAKERIGYIYYENNTVNCYLPYSQKLPQFFFDMEIIMGEIKKDLEEENIIITNF